MGLFVYKLIINKFIDVLNKKQEFTALRFANNILNGSLEVIVM